MQMPLRLLPAFISRLLLFLMLYVAAGVATGPPTAFAGASQEKVAMANLLRKGMEELVDLDVFLATGTAKPLKLAPSVATVITAEDLERLGVTTLDEALETVPGLHVMPSVTNLFMPSWIIRGIYSQLNPHVLLMVDGQPLRANVNGNKPFSYRIPISAISRIEIVRGPGSAVHGADAFAGTVNVITKAADDIRGTRGGIRIGSFDTQNYWAEHGGSYGGWDIALGADYRKTDGDRGRVIGRDALGSGSPSLAPGPLDTHFDGVSAHLVAQRGGFTSRIFYNEGFETGHGAEVAQILTGDGHSKGRQLLGALSYVSEDLLPDFDLTSTLSGSYIWGENYFRFFPANVRNMVGNPGVNELNGGFELAGDYDGFADHRLRVVGGVSYFSSDPYQRKNFGLGVPVQFGELVDVTDTPYNYLGNQHRSLVYAALQDEWSFANGWELTVGARYDQYSDFGGAFNPRIALVWNTTPELTSKLMYGRAFRPPAFGELHFQNNPATLGNKDLEPETLDSLELAFDYRPISSVRLGINLFAYTINGLIDYVADPAPATTKTASNARDQEGRGFEVEADWAATDALRLRGNFAYQRSKDKDTGRLVPDVPGMKLSADAEWKFLPEWSITGQYLWIADRHRAAGDNRPEIDDYDLVNLVMRRKNILRHWDVALAVRNLFNSDAREPSDGRVPGDYPMEGRSFWAELRYTF